MPALAAGASSSAPPGFQLTIPPAAATGNYYIIARADADGQVPESNESNNTKATAIHIGPPDLFVSSLSVSATSGADLTTTLTVTDITRNQAGTGPAAPTVTRFSLSTDATLGAGDVALGFRNVPALPPGSSSSGSTSLPVPSGTAPGTYYVIAKANADSSTPETNVTNNTRSIKIVIGPGSVHLLTVRSGHRRSGSARRRDRHHEEPGPRLGGGLGDRVLPVRERGARRGRRSARYPPGRNPPAKQLQHDQDHADDPRRDAGGQLLHHRGGR